MIESFFATLPQVNRTMLKSKIQAVSYFFPEKRLSSEDLEHELSKNGTYTVPKGTIELITGIQYRYQSDDVSYHSTLAANACLKLFSEYAIDPQSIDLLIFASAGQDILEPATAHIVQNLIGTHCPVFDLTNACNSFLDALSVADALIKAHGHTRILIATGEVSTKTIKKNIQNRLEFKKNFPSYTFGDAGTAVLVEPTFENSGIISASFAADSAYWDMAMFPGGGSRFPETKDFHFQGNGDALKQYFEKIGPDIIKKFLMKNDLDMDSIQHVLVHQVSVPYLQAFAQACHIPLAKLEDTVSWCGNIAAATLPLQWALRTEKGFFKKGDLVLIVGLAGGVSIGTMLVRI